MYKYKAGEKILLAFTTDSAKSLVLTSSAAVLSPARGIYQAPLCITV